jgi:hypothetical protein
MAPKTDIELYTVSENPSPRINGGANNETGRDTEWARLHNLVPMIKHCVNIHQT